MIDSKPWAWDLVKPGAHSYWEVPADEFLPIVSRWKEKKYSRILDLGCGTGRHAIFLAQNGFAVDAFDLSSDGIDTLKEKAQNQNVSLEIQVGDMLNLPYGANMFDCVLAFHATQHSDLAGVKEILQSIHRILEPNGEAFLTLASKESSSWKTYTGQRINDYTLIKTEGPEIEVPHTYLNYDEVLEVLKDFTIIKMQQIMNYLPKQNKYHINYY